MSDVERLLAEATPLVAEWLHAQHKMPGSNASAMECCYGEARRRVLIAMKVPAYEAAVEALELLTAAVESPFGAPHLNLQAVAQQARAALARLREKVPA